MKKLFILFFAITTIGANAQNDFAPIGAKWHYYSEDYSSGWQSIYILESIGDTVIKAKTCKILRETDILKVPDVAKIDTTISSNVRYVYYENNKVFWFKYNNFYKLYDFDAKVGDSWEVPFEVKCGYQSNGDSLGNVLVEKIDTMTINGQMLRRIYLNKTTDSKVNIPIVAIEHIGSMGNIFPVCSLLLA